MQKRNPFLRKFLNICVFEQTGMILRPQRTPESDRADNFTRKTLPFGLPFRILRNVFLQVKFCDFVKRGEEESDCDRSEIRDVWCRL